MVAKRVLSFLNYYAWSCSYYSNHETCWSAEATERQGVMTPQELAYKLEEITNSLTLIVLQNPTFADQVEEVLNDMNEIVEELGRDI